MLAFIFYFFSAAAILSALAVIFHPKPTRALLALILTMFSLAVLYLLLEAPFIAVANIIVYAGAVLVLFLFVIMMQGLGAQDIALQKRFEPFYLIGVFAVTVLFIVCLLTVLRGFAFYGPIAVHGSVAAIGRAIFTEYLLTFELTSLLLLLGIWAGVALAKKDPES